MADFNEKLGRKKEAAIIALLANRNVEDAARACNTPTRTLHRWLKEPDFDAAYRLARRQTYEQSMARLQQGSTAAATTLLKMAVDPAVPPAIRVRAAACVLGLAGKSIENDIEARIAALELATALKKAP